MEYNLPPYKTELPHYPEREPKREVVFRRRPNPMINVMLFLMTVFSTLFVGAAMEGGNPMYDWTEIFKGIPFAGTLLAIIGCHEFGHYFMCKKHKVEATLPYFIPAPTIIGTLGAVIKIRSPIKTTKALFDIGAAGPIAGFIVALPVIYFGLQSSEIRETAAGQGGMVFGDPLIMKAAIWMILGEVPEGFTVYISSVGFAGWVGMLVTAFNLMPLGQLDGGHIAYAMIGERQSKLGYMTFMALILLSLIWWGWVIWIILAVFMKIRHPAGMTKIEPLDPLRKRIGYLCLVMFVICFIPVPIEDVGIIEMIRIIF